jgi:hypothetical protein
MSLLKGDVAEEPTDESSNTDPATVAVAEDEVAEERQVVEEQAQPIERDDAPAIMRSGDVPPAEGNNEDEESIDNYMAQLLKRVRGVGAANEGPASQAPPPVSRPAQPVSAQSSLSAESAQNVQEIPTKLVRRTPAPELSSDLAAMRELANLSARAAIDKHAYRNWGRAAFGKLTIALLAAGTGAGAVYFAPAPDSMLMYAGLSSFVVALFWLLQAGILTNNVVKASRRRDQSHETVDNDQTEEVCEESSDESAFADEEEYAPAELIQAHDAYDVVTDEPAADEVSETVASDRDDGDLSEAPAELSDDSGEASVASDDNQA